MAVSAAKRARAKTFRPAAYNSWSKSTGEKQILKLETLALYGAHHSDFDSIYQEGSVKEWIMFIE